MNVQQWLLLVVLSALPSTTTQGAAPGGPKTVFAHYMMCFHAFTPGCAPGPNCSSQGAGQVQGYMEEMALAQRYGLDGFALEWLGSDAFYAESFERIFAACEALNAQPGRKPFQLIPMLDGENYTFVQETLRLHVNSPCQYRVDGRPVVSSWGGGVNWHNATAAAQRAQDWFGCLLGLISCAKEDEKEERRGEKESEEEEEKGRGGGGGGKRKKRRKQIPLSLALSLSLSLSLSLPPPSSLLSSVVSSPTSNVFFFFLLFCFFFFFHKTNGCFQGAAGGRAVAGGGAAKAVLPALHVPAQLRRAADSGRPARHSQGVSGTGRAVVLGLRRPGRHGGQCVALEHPGLPRGRQVFGQPPVCPLQVRRLLRWLARHFMGGGGTWGNMIKKCTF